MSMQFELSNGLKSPFAGQSGVDKCNMQVSLAGNRAVRKIRVKASKNWVNEIRFCDIFDNTIAEVKADSGVGEWNDINLE